MDYADKLARQESLDPRTVLKQEAAAEAVAFMVGAGERIGAARGMLGNTLTYLVHTSRYTAPSPSRRVVVSIFPTARRTSSGAGGALNGSPGMPRGSPSGRAG